eukprot:CAMPEP_0177761972 /NCGR_PEP_ID=MMETSP0491_2-20121128/6095_1 /TAXON_ID=63592 /ORGANISM="Tetraselmis chuii, Strain PLY429" /LENGTH=51 /DNA_ID=CAMNT_0019277993 /DNA_START=82 /DNA_END=237 /DNA_ORIENTATION=-
MKTSVTSTTKTTSIEALLNPMPATLLVKLANSSACLSAVRAVTLPPSWKLA